MRAKELKEYLAEDDSRILKVIENAGFHSVKVLNGEIRCALPDKTNPTGVMIKLNDTLYTSLFELGYNGDLIGALGVVLEDDFKGVLNYIHSLLGLTSGGEIVNDPLRLLNSFAMDDSSRNISEGNKLYDKSILNQFVQGIHYSIVEEGISPLVARNYGICYDPQRDRIVFPHYDWENTDKIVGLKGRSTLSAGEIELLGVAKYWNYISGYKKTQNLYGFDKARENLNVSKMLILFEGEKSVLKQATLSRGNGHSVALGGHVISEAQVEFILKNTPMDCEIVLAFDKDVFTNEREGEVFVKEQASRFIPFRRVSYINDKFNLLDEKDSPIDRGYKKWNYLLKWRTQVENKWGKVI